MQQSYLERRFFNSFIDAFRKHVSSILLQRNLDFVEYDWQEIKREFKSEMVKRAQNHIRGILLLGLFEGREQPRGVKIPPETVDERLKQFWYTSRFRVGLDRLMDRILDDIRETKLENKPTEELKDRLKGEMNKFRAVVRTESQHAINWGREIEYRERDPLNRFRYEWGIRRDHRTTPQCLEIAQRVEEEKKLHGEKGVRLDRLKAIVKEVALKYDPDYPYRDWVPHYNCRSKLRRVVL